MNFLPPTGELMQVQPKKKVVSTLFSTTTLVSFFFFLFFFGRGGEEGLSSTVPWYAHPNATFI